MTGSSSSAGIAWRTRDIVITAIIGVAFGVVFWAWGLVYNAAEPILGFTVWAKDLLYGVWLLPAVLAPLIVRKPGAAIFAEVVGAGVSSLLGSQWGVDVLVSGLMQGLGAEVVFLATRYRSWSAPTLAAAAAGTAIAAWIHDWIVWYPDVATDIQLFRGIAMVISALVFVAGGSIVLARSLANAGVLDGFPGGAAARPATGSRVG